MGRHDVRRFAPLLLQVFASDAITMHIEEFRNLVGRSIMDVPKAQLSIETIVTDEQR